MGIDDPNRGIPADPTQGNPSPAMFDAINAYAVAAGDQYVDAWIDRSKPGAPIVVAFTGDVDKHRAALLASVPAAGGPSVTAPAALPPGASASGTAPSAAPGGTSRSGGAPAVSPATPSATTLVEAGWPIEVVLLDDPVSRLRGLRNRVLLYGRGEGASLHVGASNNVNADGRLEVQLTALTDDTRRSLSARFGADKICFRLGRMAPAVS